MPELPSWHYRKVVKTLESFGYEVSRQKGSHIRMVCKGKDPVTVPAHDPVARGTLRKILRDSNISVELFIHKKQK